MRRTPSIWSIALALSLFSGLVLGLLPRGEPRFGGPFALVDQHGATVTEVSLRGRPFVVFFGFTRCATVCPMTMVRLTRLRRELGAAGDDLRIVFVSVDPDDGPPELHRWLDLFSPSDIGLSGSRAARARMMDAYGVFSQGAGVGISHSRTVFLVGARGEPRGIIEPGDDDQSARSKLAALMQ